MQTPRAWNEFIASTGYSRRDTQDQLVALITETLNERGYLLGRAGTGTGKSLASVIPALSYAQTRASNAQSGPVIVTTATKALQGQYYLKDLPFMAKHYKVPGSKDPMRFSILKGKRNYLCLDRLAMPTERIEPAILDRLKKLPPEHEGDVSTLGLPKWQELALTISTDDCPGAAECIPHALASAEDGSGGCYFERAKRKAYTSDVLVINHALLAAHVKIMVATEGKIGLLPAWSVLVADECHKLTGYVQGALGWHMSQARLFKWANECIDSNEEAQTFKDLAKEFFARTVQYDKSDTKNAQQIQERDSLRHSKCLGDMSQFVEDWMEHWVDKASGSRENTDKKRARRCANLLQDLEVALDPDDRDNFWVELDKQGNKILYYKPAEKKCAEFMRDYLWPLSPAILLSATTPTAESLGLPKDTEEFEADSPFDYRNQSRLYISKLDGAPPRDRYERELWEQDRHNEMLKLVAASDGRALLLFTSWADLNKAHDALAPRLAQAGVKVLRQQRDAESERDRLAREFKEDEHSVLFGTESFFEGIDIPGKSLQLVVISKMPFPAMVDNTRGGKLDFKTEMLPEMRMKIVQAAGRLIRTHEDQGLVAILDSRMLSKPYGRNIIANVSPFNEMRTVKTLPEAMAYLESLEEEEMAA